MTNSSTTEYLDLPAEARRRIESARHKALLELRDYTVNQAASAAFAIRSFDSQANELIHLQLGYPALKRALDVLRRDCLASALLECQRLKGGIVGLWSPAIETALLWQRDARLMELEPEAATPAGRLELESVPESIRSAARRGILGLNSARHQNPMEESALLQRAYDEFAKSAVAAGSDLTAEFLAETLPGWVLGTAVELQWSRPGPKVTVRYGGLCWQRGRWLVPGPIDPDPPVNLGKEQVNRSFRAWFLKLLEGRIAQWEAEGLSAAEHQGQTQLPEAAGVERRSNVASGSEEQAARAKVRDEGVTTEATDASGYVVLVGRLNVYRQKNKMDWPSICESMGPGGPKPSTLRDWRKCRIKGKVGEPMARLIEEWIKANCL